ncbi:MAG TPA: GntR family transcriptional regulator [Lachnospiraceae bacterium]
MAWKLDSQRPIYLQIVERIQYDIVSGRYKPGERLPSVRDLALEASVNPNTMQKALSELEQGQLVYSQRTSGRFVTEDLSLIQSVREELAKYQIRDLIMRMKKLGFQKDGILKLIDSIYEEVAISYETGM